MAAVFDRNSAKYWKWPRLDIPSISNALEKSEMHLPFNMLNTTELGEMHQKQQCVTSLSLSLSLSVLFFKNCCLY